jgi:hypothetical protein
MYELLRQDIYGVFATNAWKALNINTYPENYQGAVSTSTSFIKLAILPGKGSLDGFQFSKKLSGAIILSIFVKAGNGDKDIFTIADNLDNFFEGKTLQNGTQFGPSSVTILGLDRDDPSLFRGDYMITFNTFGD